MLICAARGLSIEETVAELVKAVETIKTQRKTAIRVLGARNITHAVARAYERGLLWPSADVVALISKS